MDQSVPPFEVTGKPKKSAIAGKHGQGYSTARHLARMAMQKVIKQSPDLKKYTKEETIEEVNEVSNELLQRYKQKAGAQVDDPSTPSSLKYKRGKGHLMATIKQMKSGKPMPPIQKEETTMKSFQTFRVELLEKTLTPAEMKKREEVAKAIERENPEMPMAKKMAIATATAKKVAEENIEEMHYCAKHVYSDVFGEGLVVEGDHADPAEDGSIEWYNVKFDHGVEQVYTEDVKVMFAEYHMNHKRKKKMGENSSKEVEEELVGNQHKIDANKNNKIDAHDFKLLRKIKKNRMK